MKKMLKRRRFLRGLAGATIALPFLESVHFGRPARADSDRRVYNLIFKQGNGVAQEQRLANGTEPERFWPRETGAFTQEILAGRDSDRALSVLAPMADHLTVVSGTAMIGMGQCRHAASQAQLLSAQPVLRGDNSSRAGGETVDWFIASRCNPEGVEPLNFRSGRIEGHAISGAMSYRGAGDAGLRAQQNNPAAIYRDLFGGTAPEFEDLVGPRRMSVNDLVREDFDRLLSSSVLSRRDRTRLEDHRGFVRDMEVRLTCGLPEEETANFEDLVDYDGGDGNVRHATMRLLMDLTAYAFECDLNRTAVLQMGDCADGTRYVVDGVRQNSFHAISHRTGVENDLQLVHHKIDRSMAETFLYFLNRVSEMTGPSGGSLLDHCLAVWCNDLARGGHSVDNMPFVLAGGANGFLRTGVYVDASRGGSPVSHNKLLNTLIAANGITNDAGSYYDRFGAASLEGGVIDAIIA
ncbi:MAG: DUF1552 domain-containing protein [Myxococcota bacterium]